jgi:hypothetical protein
MMKAISVMRGVNKPSFWLNLATVWNFMSTCTEKIQHLERFPTNLDHRHRPAGDPFGAGRICLMAASLVGCDAQGIAPASRLALKQIPRRADGPDWSENAPRTNARISGDSYSAPGHP